MLGGADGASGVVEMLLGRGDVDPNGRWATAMSPLMYAAGMGHREVMRVLLREEVRVERRDGQGNTALVWAVQLGQVETVSMLSLREDVDVNAYGPNRTPVLGFAARCGCVEIIALLMQRDDLDVNIRDGSRMTALVLAAFAD